MQRLVFCLLLAMCFVGTAKSFGQALKAPLIEPIIETSSSWADVSIMETSPSLADVDLTSQAVNWSALGNDINKVYPALVVLQQELKPGVSLDLSKSFEIARNELVRNVNSVAKFKIDKAKKLQSVFGTILDPNGLSEEQIESIKSYRNDLTELIKDIARDRKADLNSITVYKDLADSIDLYVLLENCKNKDYYSFLNELEGSLYDYASAHRDLEYREALGQNVARLKAIGKSNCSASADRFISTIDSLTRQPNVRLSVSERAINELVKSSKFKEIKEPNIPVDECLLGTRILGTADTIATPQIDLRSAVGCAAMNLYLNGEVATNSIGYRKPVQVRTVGLSPFFAQTQIRFNNSGLVWTPPTASATTNTTICSIDKVGCQIFSRLVKRIARKQAAKQKPKAEAIGSERLARRLEDQIGKKLNEPLSKAREFIDTRFRPLSKVLGGLDFGSTENELTVVATYSRLAQLTVPIDLPTPAPQSQIPEGMTTSGDVVIQIHQSILDQVQRRKFADETREKKIAVSIAILDRLIDEVFSNDEDSSDSGLFELVFKSLRNSSNPTDGQGDNLGTKVFKKLGNLKFKTPVYDEETEWFTIHGYIRN